jgi:hypothetical protein
MTTTPTLGTLAEVDFADFAADDRDERAMTNVLALYRIAPPELKDDAEFLGHLAGLYVAATGNHAFVMYRRLAETVAASIPTEAA